MAASSISTGEEQPPRHQVFISFRGADLRRRFVSHLVTALELNNINVFIDDYEDRGQPLEILLQRIEESKIALAIFSGKYTDSIWCVRELEKIKACVDEGTLIAIPIFYKVEPSTVRGLKGSFGDKFRSLAKGDQRKKKWKEAFNTIPDIMGITVEKKSVESEKVNETVKAVKRVLNRISSEGSRSTSLNPSENVNGGTSSVGQKHKTFGNEQRLKELGEKLDRTKYKGTRVIGVVGMPGIGKTTLLKELYETWRCRFSRHVLLDQIHEKFKHVEELDCLPEMLVTALLKSNNGHIDDDKDPYSQLQERKVLVLLDDVTKKEQIDVLREILGRIKEGNEGSRVVIATSDMSLLNDMVDDTYMVQNLNHSDSSQLFHYHTFGDQAYPPREDVFAKLSEKFVHYARGHPLALKILGAGLNPNNIEHWKSKLDILAQLQIPTEIRSVFKVSYDELCSEHKNAFLDIACFRSEEVDYVESLLASSDPRSAEAMSPVKALTDKFLINTCDGRVEMHDLLYTFSRELDSEECPQYGSRKRRLWLHKHIIKGRAPDLLQTTTGTANVRGVFLDLSEVKGEMSLDKYYFRNMVNLRYLKFYNSHCPQECNTYNKINIPDGLKLPLKEVRCLHWLKFPLEELPNDFNPVNLVDLKLPYSKIQQLWEGVKDTPFLKWVDLSYSSKLCSLSGLLEAIDLQRLNLEGCTALKTLPGGMRKMKKLSFLNLKGCTSLESIPEMSLISLKTLTLSGCFNFKEFPLVSENIENLYLDGTAISQLPENMEKLQRLVVLNMKSCKMLQKIPDRVGELKALQELILSDSSNLSYFPEINMISLKILLLDGTAIEVMPRITSLQYLCLSRNDEIKCLPAGISKLSQLKWLDLKYCRSLTSVPELPPNLQCLDVHGCSSLETVSKPLAHIMPTEQNHSTFIFSNCKNLEQAAKEEITSYAKRKCQLLSYAHKRYNGGLVSEALFSTCFPGCEVPSWFCHEKIGSELEVKLPPHWHDKKLAGIALCAVVSFHDSQDQISCLSVTCTFKVKVEDKSWVPFTCPVGSWTRQGDGKYKIDSDHVFIGYTSCPYTIKCPEDENSDKCSSTEACLEFTVTGGTSEKEKLDVLKCGLCLVYAKDKSKNSSHGAKYDLPVEVGVQETSRVVDEEAKKKKKRRGDDGRPKKKPKSRRDDSIPCQLDIDASVIPRSNDNSVGKAHG